MSFNWRINQNHCPDYAVFIIWVVSVDPYIKKMAMPIASVAMSTFSVGSLANEAVTAEQEALEVIQVRGTPMSRYYVRESQGATRIATDVMDIPRAVTLIPEQVIIDQQATELEDVLRNVSSVSRSNGTGGTNDDYTMRGFRRNSTYRDGFASANAKIATGNVESIEVIKGPASVLYGAVQPGGIVNVVTKKPQAEDYQLLHLTTDEHGKKYVLADSTGALNQDASLLYRLVASGEDSETFRQGVDKKRLLLSPSLGWYLNDDTFFNLNFEYQKNDVPIDHGVIGGFVNNDPALAIRPLDLNVEQTFIEDFDFSKETIKTLALDFESNFNNGWRLRAKLVGQKTDSETLESRAAATIHGYQVYLNNLLVGDLSSLAALGLKPAVDGTFLRAVTGTKGDSDKNYAGFSLDNRFVTGEASHQVLVGAEWNKSSSFVSRWDGENQALQLRQRIFNIRSALAEQNLAAAASLTAGIEPDFFQFNAFQPQKGQLSAQLTSRVFNFDAESKEYGMYIQDQISIGESLKILAGARYDHFEAEMFTNRFGNGINSQGNNSDSQMSYQLGGLYKWYEYLSTYISYSESFNPQSAGRLAFAADANTRGLLQPELGKQYEVGSKLSLLDEKLTMTLAYFDIEKRNILSLTPGTDGSLTTTLLGALTSKGIELDATAQLDQGLNLVASLSSLDVEISDVGETAAANRGNRPHNVADKTASLWLSYEPKETQGNTWGVAGGIFYSGDRYGDDANSWSLGSYTTFDLGAWYYLPIGEQQLKLHLSVKNLTDKKYYLASGNVKERITPAKPRTINFSVSYLF